MRYTLNPDGSCNEIKEIHLDYSKRTTLRECLRKFFFNYIRHIAPEKGSTALRFGSTFHAMLEGFYEQILLTGWGETQKAIHRGLSYGKIVWDEESSKQDFNLDYRTFEQCCELFLAYVTHWQNDAVDMEVVETEQAFKVELELTEEEAKLGLAAPVRKFFIGKIDLVAKMHGALTIVDHKTTSSYLKNMERELGRSPQGLGYLYGYGLKTGNQPVQVYMNFAHQSCRWSAAKSQWGAIKVEFGRFPQMFTPEDIRQWRLAFLHSIKEIYTCLSTGFWPQCTESCFTKFGACPYLSLCEQDCGVMEVHLDGYRERVWNPADEIEKLKKIKERFEAEENASR